MKRKSQYIRSLAAVFLLSLCAGCSQESGLDSGGNTRNAGEIHFFVEGIEGSSENDITTRSLAGSETPITFVKKLDNGYTLTGTLETEPEGVVLSRAGDPQSLPNSTQYSIVAYKDDGDAENDSKQEIFLVGGNESQKLILTPGTYQLYAYSYGSAAALNKLSQDDLRSKRIPYKEGALRELLFYAVPNKVTVAADGSVSNSQISITFKRQTSMLTVLLDGGASQTAITGGKLSISPCKRGSFDVSLVQPNWNTSTIVNESEELTLPDFTQHPSSYSVTSACYIIPQPNVAVNRTVKLKDIKIAGVNMLKSMDLPFSHKFQAGFKYTMKIKVTPPSFSEDIEIDGVKWARANTIKKSKNGDPVSFFDYSYQCNLNQIGPSMWGYMTTQPGPYSGGDILYGTYRDETINWNEDRFRNISNTTFPCPRGYRLPTAAEFGALLSKKHCVGQYDGIRGMFFDTETQPTSGTESNYLFLPYAGRYMLHIGTRDILYDEDRVGYYWTCDGKYTHATQNSPDPEDKRSGDINGASTNWTSKCAVLTEAGGASLEDKYCAEKKLCSIRCVKQ